MARVANFLNSLMAKFGRTAQLPDRLRPNVERDQSGCSLRDHDGSAKDIAFIIGTGRSGTTMLAKILNAHSRICVPPELQVIFEYSNNGSRLHELFSSGKHKRWQAKDYIKKIGKICPNHLESFFDYSAFFRRQKFPIEDLGLLLLDFYRAIAESWQKDLFIEQTPWYGQRLDIMKELFPEAKFIHMIRDGRDVALSFARSPWWHDSPLENLDRWQQEINRIADEATTILDSNQYLAVKYEDFVLAPEEQLQRITGFLGVAFEPEMLLPEKIINYDNFVPTASAQTTSVAYNNWRKKNDCAIFTDNVYGWRKANAETFAVMSAEATAALAKFGYDV